jgi:hypothetical protein
MQELDRKKKEQLKKEERENREKSGLNFRDGPPKFTNKNKKDSNLRDLINEEKDKEYN